MAIDQQTEVQIVAYKARGDSYQKIKDQLEKDGVSLSIEGIRKVVGRNTESLAFIKGELAKHEVAKTTKILDKSRTLIENKLDQTGYEKQESILIQMYEDGEIDGLQFLDRLDKLVHRYDVNIRDLTAVSKEMFNQSQIEAGKPTSITESPAQAKENLEKLLRAINSGDDKAIAEAIFIDV